MRVRRLRADEWERWREFRLAMLADTPSAYGTTLAEASAFTDDDWQARASQFASAADSALYLAEEDDEWLACAGCFSDDGVPNVVSVWTRPKARGHGYADACVRAVVDFIRRTGATEARLWATDGNDQARRVYDRIGFTPTGKTEPLPHTPSITESEYVLPL